MAPMKRSVLALLFAVALPLGACSTAQSASVQQGSRTGSPQYICGISSVKERGR